ncbi:MAG: hypothetical protein IKM11_03505 [Oscillospiraceae bacterium]|nr:hypothetical protein [Oscillospiraceae bacterium]
MKKLHLLGITLALTMLLSACASQPPLSSVTPIEESYEYTTTSRVYDHPAMLTVQRPVEYLSLTIDDGWFFCVTVDTEKADEFVNAQRTLLQFLRDSGMETPKLNYFAMDTDDSFSESEKKRAHMALSDAKSYQQVLITLQTLWGDYTDYGYLHAVSNIIAAHLGWQTDAVGEVDQTALDAFFAENPDALNLLYPCFVADYASEETMRNCKVLSKQLLEKIDLREALTKPIDEQVNDFRALVDAYAQEISVTFSRQESGYAYYGEYIPLKISTPYVLHMVERGYDDQNRVGMEELGNDTFDYFSDYRSTFETMTIINNEIARSVEHFGLENEVGLVVMNWICAENAPQLTNNLNRSCYFADYDGSVFDGTIYLRTISAYLHEYFHHIESTIHDLGRTWQAQAFADLGSAQSQHGRSFLDWPFMYDEESSEMFYAAFGREYQPGYEDYYNAHDLICYINNLYILDYNSGSSAWNSFTHYLLDQYGEDTVPQLLLFPDTVESVTGKTWEELRCEWQAHMEKKFENFEIPDWVFGE